MALTLGSKEITAYAVLDILWRRKLLAGATVLVAAAACTAVVHRLPVRYRAQALLANQRPAAQAYVGGDPAARVQEQLVAIREGLYSPAVLDQTAREFGLAADRQAPSPRGLEEIKSRMKVTVDSDDAFYIGFEGSDAAQTAAITNRLADLLTQYFADLRTQRVEDSTDFLDAEVTRLRSKLDTHEARLRQYKQKASDELPDNRDVNLRSIDSARFALQTQSDRLATDQARLVAVDAEMKELEKQGVLKPAVPAPRERSPEEVKVGEMKLALKQAQAKYTARHPEVTRLKTELSEAEAVAAARPLQTVVPEPSVARMHYLTLKGERESLDQRLKSYQAAIAQLNEQLTVSQRRLSSTPAHETALADLARDYDTTRSQYTALLDKQQLARLASRLQKQTRGASFRIVEPAAVPKAPVGPQRSLLLAAGLLCSLGLGVGLAFAREQMDTSFNTIDEFQTFTNVAVLSTVPSISGDPKKAIAPPKVSSVPAVPPVADGAGSPVLLSIPALHRSRVVTLSDPQSVAAEQYRILALKTRQQLSRSRTPVVLMTSSVGGEGKTLTALNLSFALAANSDARVLLVESDLRKPRIHEYLGLRPGRGFSDLLLDSSDEVLKYTWKIGRLHLMLGGGSLENPVELLASNRARSLFDRLRKEFDFIVVDAPPTLPIVDAHILAGLADGVVLAVRARYTRQELFQRAVESFQATNILGVVLNDIDYRRSRYAYAYEYYSKHYLAAR